MTRPSRKLMIACVPGDLMLVRNHDHRDAAVALQLLEDFHHFDAGPGIEVPVGSSANRIGPLINARWRRAAGPRKLIGVVIGALAQSTASSAFSARFLARDRICVAGVESGSSTFSGRGPRQKVEALKHEPDGHCECASSSFDSFETSRPLSVAAVRSTRQPTMREGRLPEPTV